MKDMTVRQRQHEDAVEEASRRVSFQLTYERARIIRQFAHDGITGEPIADAYRDEGRAPGDWSSGGALTWFSEKQEVATVDIAIQQFFADAVGEVVHEALEWFKIDGVCALDPHYYETEQEIYNMTEEFARKLWAMRARQS